MKYEAVSAALAELASAQPEIADQQPVQQPEDSAWSAAPPTDKSELRRRLTEEFSATVDAVIACEAATSSWEDQRRWDQLAGAISAVVQEWPDVGLDLLGATGAGHPAIDHAVIRGWTMSHPDAELAPQIMDRIVDLELGPILDPVTAMLGGFGFSGATPVEWFSFEQSVELAKKCWETIAPDTVSHLQATDDYAMMAMNHPAGHLAEYWVHRTGHLWNVAGDNWRGIPPEVADYASEMLADESARSEPLEVAFCRYVTFMHQADEVWCRQHLFPLLNWDNKSRATKAWSGYLSHGGWTNELLRDRFLEMLLSTAAHSDQINKQGRRALTGLFASIAMSADVDPKTWVRDLITQSSVPDRVAWARAIRFQLDALDPQLVEKQWDRWMGEYLRDRISGVPRNLDPAEASAVAGWLVFLTDSMATAIELLLSTETAGLGLYDLFLHDVGEKQIEIAPEMSARLLHHLLKSTDGQFYRALEIEGRYRQLKSAGVTAELLRKIEEEATRLGINL